MGGGRRALNRIREITTADHVSKTTAQLRFFVVVGGEGRHFGF